MTILRLLKTFIGYIIVFVVGVIAGIPCFIIACLPLGIRRDNRIYYFFTDIFFKTVRWATFVPVTVKGEENIPLEPVIFVPNHASSMDIPFVASIIGRRPQTWLFLKKYKNVPIFGFILERMNIVVDLSSPRALMRALRQAIELGKEHKRDIVIFPEGGRAKEGKIDPFFPGFAIISQKTDLPIVPIRIYNLQNVFPPGAILIRDYPVTLIIGKPMRQEKDETQEAFVARVRTWMEGAAQIMTFITIYVRMLNSWF